MPAHFPDAVQLLQHVVPPQHTSPDLHLLFPQQIDFAVRQNGLVPLSQQNWPDLQEVLPQHNLPVVTQKGVVPVRQHCDFLPLQIKPPPPQTTCA